jgi:ABC-type nickel/cobalt efflux system permease component RcnA
MAERLVGLISILVGVLSLVFNKQSAQGYVEFQKGWGLEKNAYSVGQFISIFGGAFMVLIGLLMLVAKRS